MAKVKAMNRELAELTARELARELGGRVVHEVRDFYGRRIKVIAGVEAPGMPRGYGFSADYGTLQVVGDEWLSSTRLRDFEAMFLQRYMANALKAALSGMGYAVSTEEVKQNIIVRAVR
jgi:hypothetical protein